MESNYSYKRKGGKVYQVKFLITFEVTLTKRKVNIRMNVSPHGK